MSITNKAIGSSLESFLKEEGIFDKVHIRALKTVLAHQLEDAMRIQNISITDLARIMGTSRAALGRLLNPTNTSVTLHTLERAAQAVGKRLHIELI